MRYPIEKIGFTDFAVKGKYIWFCDIYHSHLIKMDIDTGKIVIEAVLPTSAVGKQMEYGPIVLHGDKLVIVPRNAEKVLVYNLENEIIQEITLKNSTKQGQRPLFISAFAYENSIFLVPGRFYAIVKLNMDNMELTYYDKIIEDVKSYQNSWADITFNCQPVVIEHYCILPVFRTNVFARMDLETGNYTIKKFDNEKREILSTAYDGKNIWFSGFEEGIFCYSLKNKKIEQYDDFSGISKPAIGIGQIMNYGNIIIAFPINESEIIVFDKIKKKYDKFLEIPSPHDGIENREWAITGCDFLGPGYVKDGIILTFSAFRGQLLQIDIEQAQLKVCCGKLSEERGVEKLLQKCAETRTIIYEEEWGLRLLIKNL